jgi:hypothetical protein
VGTNNANGDDSYDWGDLGHQLADVVNYYAPTAKYQTEAGDDIEPQWSGPSNVLTFLSSFSTYDSPNYPDLYDFGWLDGNTNGSGTNYNDPSPWTAPDLYTVTYGDAPDYPYLKLYDGTSTGDAGTLTGAYKMPSWTTTASRARARLVNDGRADQECVWNRNPIGAFTDQENALTQYNLQNTTTIAYHSQIEPLS